MTVKAGKNLVAYCGLYCGDCYLRKKEIADMAQALLKKFRAVKFEKWAKALGA